MEELLLEYIKGHNQVEQFKAWLILQEIDTEEGINEWVDYELKDIY